MSEHPNTDVQLAFDVAEMPLRALIRAGDEFGKLLSEVAREYLGRDDPATWMVRLEPGSVLMPFRSRPKRDDVSASRLRNVGPLVAEGLEKLESRAERPDYFTDKALGYACGVASVASSELPLAVQNGHGRTPITAQLIANAKTVLGPDQLSYGTIEGRLERLNVHGSANHFWVYDARTGSQVECNFTKTVTVDDLSTANAIGRRVGVRGTIHSRPNGRPVLVDADELIVFPGDPPPIDRALGVLKGYEVQDW